MGILRKEENFLVKNSGKSLKNNKKLITKGIRGNNGLALLDESLVPDAKKKLNIQRKKKERKHDQEKLKLERHRMHNKNERDELTILMENTQNMIDDKSMSIQYRTIDSALSDMKVNHTTTRL